MSLKKQATAGLVWTFAQQFGNQLIGFAVSVVLARLLMPSEFGLIGMIAIFYSIGRGLMDSGMTQSLIRSEELDQEDFSTVFYFNLIASIFFYLIIFFAAPFIADFYDQPILINIVRVYCLTFIFDAFSAVQRAKLTKQMNFKTQTLIAIPSTVIGGITGISFAFMGFGVWSLVWSTIVTSIVGSAQFWYYSKWVPSWKFNVPKFKEHLDFGYKLTLSSLLNKIFNNIYLIVIGKYFSATQVGFYTRAESTKQLPVRNLSNALNTVTFPLFARIQNDDIRLKRVYKQLMKIVVFVVAPLLVFLGVLAEPLFRFVFTEKWLPAVPYFQILCITGILTPVHSYNLNVLKIKGRSDLFLKLEVIKKIIMVVTLVITLQFGILAILYGQVLTSVIAFFINTHYTGKFIKYSAFEQTKDILPILFIAGMAGVGIFFLDSFLMTNSLDFVRVAIGLLFGGLFYMSVSYFFQFSIINDLKTLVLKR